MNINKKAIFLQPAQNSIIKYKGRWYFAATRGIGLGSYDESGFTLIYENEHNSDWGNFPYAIFFADRVTFVPRKLNELYVLDPKSNSVERFPFPRLINDETCIPYISRESLMIFGITSRCLYRVNTAFAVGIEGVVGEDCAWKSFASQTEEFISLWDEQKGKIGLIDKNNNTVKSISFSQGVIDNAAVYGNRVYVLTEDGSLCIVSADDGKVIDRVQTNLTPKQNRMFFYQNSLFIMPVEGNMVMEVVLSDNNRIKTQTIPFDSDQRKMLWVEREKGTAICISRHIERPWNHMTGMFEYHFSDRQMVEIPMDQRIRDYLISTADEIALMGEDEINGLRNWLKWVIDK